MGSLTQAVAVRRHRGLMMAVVSFERMDYSSPVAAVVAACKKKRCTVEAIEVRVES